MTYDEIRRAALEKLDAGDAPGAFAVFRLALAPIEEEHWTDALEIFADIATPVAGDEFAALVRTAAHAPDDPEALYALGFHLVEQSLPGIAASVLARAWTRQRSERILTELVSALESDGRNAEAHRVLHEAPEFLESSALCRYLLAFNAVMTGRVDEARGWLPRLLAEGDAGLNALGRRIERMVLRADLARPKELRGWHFAITGGLLLHVSAHGKDDGMNGRYAYTEDSESRCCEAIRRLAAVLDAWKAEPPRILVPDDRDSRVLALAAARHLELPLAAWPDDGPGLVVAYDLEKLDADALRAMQFHRPGQILWSHASCWTRDFPIASDLATYLYQYNRAPWDAGLSLDPRTGELGERPAAEGPPEELAARILQAKPYADAVEDLPELAEFARTTAPLAAALASEGSRERLWMGGPVPSNRFL